MRGTNTRKTQAEMPLLRVVDLKTHFTTDEGTARAVDGVTFHIDRGETLGLVGESGCGKSVTCLSILRLVPPPGEIVGGDVRLEGVSLLDASEREIRRVRGGRISMIFQEPMTALNPVFSVGNQIMETIRAHERVSSREAKRRAIELLRQVEIPSPERRLREYPHEMSGGMRQRVMIAMALACGPALLLADEPTTALDVVVQAQIIRLLQELQKATGLSILLVTHDLALVAQVAHRIAVMYASKIVEEAPSRELFRRALYPYTQGLLRSRPSIGQGGGAQLPVIPGQVPNPLAFPGGCKFHPRCPLAIARCALEEPVLRELRPEHRVACHLAEEVGLGSSPARAEETGDGPAEESRTA